MTEPLRDLFSASVEGNSGPVLPDPSSRRMFPGDAFLLVGDDGVKRMHVWNGSEWVAADTAPVFKIEEGKP